MKRINYVIVFITLFFISLNNVYAANINNAKELESKLVEKIEEVNKKSFCYTSEIKMENDSEIGIYYKLINGKSCSAVDDWSYKIKFDNGFISSKTLNIEFDEKYKNKDLGDLLNQDIVWFDTLMEVIGYDITFDNLETEIDNGVVHIVDKKLYSYISEYVSSNSAVYKINYIASYSVLLNHDVYELDKVTSDSISIKAFEYAYSNAELLENKIKISMDGKNFENVKLPNSSRVFPLVISDLKPGKKYYIRINSEIYGEYNLEATTLDVSKPTDKDSEASNKDQVNNNQKPNENKTENPDTGSKSVGVILILFVAAILLIYKKRDVFKNI